MEHNMEGMDHAMHGMTEMAAATGFDYSLAFVAGFLGSGHCLGMCGALVSGYFMRAGKSRSYLPYIAYQAARISVYTLIGVLAASLGVVLVSSGLFGKIQSILQMLMGAVVIVLALGVLGWIPWQGSIRLIPMQVLRKGYAAANQKGPLLGSVIAGLLNGLMPCMLTFAMAVKATTAATLLEGGALMLAFGAGTLPMMLFISVAFGKMSVKLRGLMLKAAAFIMLLMGANTINNGLSFYQDQNFNHSHFLVFVQDKLDELIVFLHETLNYIGSMLSSIQGV
ncbi:sulfite exporter TauE/SafE family protein [Methylomonas sp. MO1]|uniref:sulfite exporter TauE/SafE family protein n=1 Tax=unclassified Methylomonas TaxID=2608980 RepID=UPI00047B2E16|nr:MULTISPECIES: sulfite exporter TauE/SafE family protein [unclassified Methylomonas]MDT4288145.1 sulfite exporter TauE/SafE family protein [Methylomonas sp. MO1]